MDSVERPDRDSHALPGRASTVTATFTEAPVPVGRDHALLVGVLDAERADLEPAERRAVASERLGDRPDIGSRADAKVKADDAVRIRDDVERVDARAPQRHLHLDAAAVQLVGALTADLDRGRGRDRQLDLAAEAREPLLELVRRGRARATRRPPLPDRPWSYGT